MKNLPYILSALALCISHASAEQFFKGKVEDGPHIGLVTGGDTGSDSLAWGWQAQYNQNSYFSWDLSFTAHDDEVEADSGSGLPSAAQFDLEDYSLSLGLRVNLMASEPINVYIGGGLNYHIFEEELTSSATTTGLVAASPEIKDTLGYHFSLGLEYLLSEKWEMFAESRYIMLSPEVTLNTAVRGGDGQLISSQFRDDLDYNYFLLRLGLNYRF